MRVLYLTLALLTASAGAALAQTPDAGVPPVEATPETPPAETPPAETGAGQDEGAAAAPEGDAVESEDATEEEKAEEQKETEPENGYVMPDAPALTVLDATGNKIDRPGSARELGIALANVLAPDGTVRAGLSVELNAHSLGLVDTPTHYEYVHSWVQQFLNRSSISLASVSGSPAAPGLAADTHFAIGARLVFWDDSDPLLDHRYKSAVDYAYATCKPKEKNPAEHRTCISQTYEEYEEWDAEIPWNKGKGLALALAQSLVFNESKIGDMDGDTFAAWLSGSLGVKTWGQVIGGLTLDHSWIEGETRMDVAARFRIGTKRVRVVADGAFTLVQPDEDVTRGRFAIGVEVAVQKNVWVTASLASEINEDFDASQVFAVSNVKWSYASKPSW